MIHEASIDFWLSLVMLIHLLQPLAVRPLETAEDIGLPVDAGLDVEQIVEIFEEFALDVAREDLAGALAEEVRLAEKEAVAFLGDDAFVVEVRAGQCSVDVSVPMVS